MSQHRMILGLLVLAGAAFCVSELDASPAPQLNFPGGVVAFRLGSGSDGQTVAPLQEVSWRVKAWVSPDDNQGLALFSFDFVQDPGNPELFNIPRGTDPIPIMQCFDQPGGFTNPGFKITESGYRGTQSDEWGQRNLRQIGGAQNTFGKVGPCHGQVSQICMGQDIDVDGGIGQLPNGVLLTTGKFRAPLTPGTYTMRIENMIANTLAAVEVAPTPSLTFPAAIRIFNDTITFTVQ